MCILICVVNEKEDYIYISSISSSSINDCNRGCINWASNVKKLLNDYGFSDIFVDIKTFPQIFKCRVIYTYKQEWYSILKPFCVSLLQTF